MVRLFNVIYFLCHAHDFGMSSPPVSGLTLITPDNTTTLTDYVNSYPASSTGSNHWVGSCSIGQVVDENARVMNTDNLVRTDLKISNDSTFSPF